jgi:hypothetical protein
LTDPEIVTDKYTTWTQLARATRPVRTVYVLEGGGRLREQREYPS